MPIRVCYVAGRELSYSRTRNVLKALQSAGFDVTVVAPAARSKLHHVKVLWQFLSKRQTADVILVGFYGQLLMPFVRLLTKKPIVFDVYAATYGTLVDDRVRAKHGSLAARLFWFADHLAMKCADRIVLDSNHHIEHYASRYHIPQSKFRRLFLFSDESIMRPRQPPQKSERMLVHFHGEYAPFHGVDVIVRAAKLLEHQPIDFQLIGRGITYQRDRALSVELGLTNVQFIDNVPYAELSEYMSRADVCLGIFGLNPRAERELTNKVVEAIALGKPLVTRTSPSVTELLVDGESALLVEPGDPQAVADALLALQRDPALRERLGKKGLEVFHQHCTQAAFAEQLRELIETLVAEPSDRSTVVRAS
jgi:glycosyltransferase involved in cell wall biosynthesis